LCGDGFDRVHKILLALGNDMQKLLKSYIAAIFTGVTAGICVSLLLGTGFCLPIKPMILVAYYLILRHCTHYVNSILYVNDADMSKDLTFSFASRSNHFLRQNRM